MSPQLSPEAAAVSPAVFVSEQRYIKEWVRFWFHGLAISLCGILVPLMPAAIALKLLLFVLVLFTWYEFLRCRPRLQRFISHWPLWPVTHWMSAVARAVKVRPHEVGTRSAALDFLLGFGLVWAICPSWVVATACFITAWADPLARVVGKRWGRLPWPWGKTIEGSTICFLIAATFAYFSLHWKFGPDARVLFLAGGIGLVTMMAELIPQWPQKPKPGDLISPADNFWLIIFSTTALEAARRWIVA